MDTILIKGERASGKTTLARAIQHLLASRGVKAAIHDNGRSAPCQGAAVEIRVEEESEGRLRVHVNSPRYAEFSALARERRRVLQLARENRTS